MNDAIKHDIMACIIICLLVVMILKPTQHAGDGFDAAASAPAARIYSKPILMPIYNREALHCLAANIYWEGRNQTRRGQVAIGLVTLNRVADNHYPSSVCSVVKQHKQFSWYSDGLSDTVHDTIAYDKAINIASSLLDKDNAIRDFTQGALFYHADYVSPYWKDELTHTITIETHIFYTRS